MTPDDATAAPPAAPLPAAAARRHWLGRDLLWRLMLPLLAIVVATGALGTWGAQRRVDRVFDRWLLDGARAVASLVRFEQGRATLRLPPEAEAVLLYDDTDRTWYHISQDGHLVAGSAGLPAQGAREAVYQRGRAFDAHHGGEAVRVARVDVDDGAGHRATVLVAETLTKRLRAEQDLVLMLWPMLALLLAAALAIAVAVRRTVRPLEAIAARWKERTHASLAPIGADDVPRELMPFANALNDLLARIRAMLARERRFAATAAHQLRTPLAGLQLGLARAAEAGDPATLRSVLGDLQQATQRAARLVQQLLALGRLDPEARGAIERRPTDLVALAQDVGAALADQALAKNIQMELEAPAQPVRADVQPKLVAEALSNLIENAIRYTPAGGRLAIDFDPAPPTVRIADSGPGIPEDEREAVFEPFARGRHARGDGTGLGLAIVRDIARLHGAHVTLGDSDWGGLRVTLRFGDEPAG